VTASPLGAVATAVDGHRLLDQCDAYWKSSSGIVDRLPVASSVRSRVDLFVCGVLGYSAERPVQSLEVFGPVLGVEVAAGTRRALIHDA
jgi:hypothetical protein